MSSLHLTRQQVREVDRRAIEQCGMSGLVLMENAGRGCAEKICELGIAGPVVICCGRGNNGGDGFVIARHLEIRGCEVRVLLFCNPDLLRGDAAANLSVLRHCDVPVSVLGHAAVSQVESLLAGADWIVDALLGTGAKGEPRPPINDVIHVLNRWSARRLAIDLPSGLDCDTGHPARATFHADHTCTFVAAKSGFAVDQARPYLGQIHVLDIGVPKRLVADVAGF
jgi:NAD(P)H-hydrate epimerase